MSQPEADPFYLSKKIRLVPVVNSDGSFARAIERWLFEQQLDCLFVPLPLEVRNRVLEAVNDLPLVSTVIQAESNESAFSFHLQEKEWTPENEDTNEDEQPKRRAFYVPIDPCQAVIAAIRYAIGEHIPVVFGDLPTADFMPFTSLTADAYALRECRFETFATAMLPAIGPMDTERQKTRVEYLAHNLHKAEQHYQRIIALCPLAMWPWLRQAYGSQSAQADSIQEVDEAALEVPFTAQVDENSLLFFLAELPYATGIHERLREKGAVHSASASIDFVKHLLITARQTYKADLRDRARKIPPLMLNQCMQYIRNLTLLDRRLTPDFYTIVTAAKQIVGDQYAVHVIEAAKQYAYSDFMPLPVVRFGISEVQLPDGEVCEAINRLDSPTLNWRSIELNPRPKKVDSRRWAMQWNPYAQCSWPPEDKMIESFRSRLMERAQNVISSDLAQSEKFSTSLMDGIDIRETLRHWYDSQIYVKRIPPSVGKLDACVMLFDVPADPRDYPWRATWFAEHGEESTLAFYATNFQQEMLGPGIGVSTYGGSMLIYPPRYVKDIWTDPRLDFCDTLEQRLIAGACANCDSRHVVLLSPVAPTLVWKKTAKHFGKVLVHLPSSKFSDATLQQLRMFHVLNGKQVRSYAARFIRRV